MAKAKPKGRRKEKKHIPRGRAACDTTESEGRAGAELRPGLVLPIASTGLNHPRPANNLPV